MSNNNLDNKFSNSTDCVNNKRDGVENCFNQTDMKIDMQTDMDLDDCDCAQNSSEANRAKNILKNGITDEKQSDSRF